MRPVQRTQVSRIFMECSSRSTLTGIRDRKTMTAVRLRAQGWRRIRELQATVHVAIVARNVTKHEYVITRMRRQDRHCCRGNGVAEPIRCALRRARGPPEVAFPRGTPAVIPARCYFDEKCEVQYSDCMSKVRDGNGGPHFDHAAAGRCKNERDECIRADGSCNFNPPR
jgi:hypothetical protein